MDTWLLEADNSASSCIDGQVRKTCSTLIGNIGADDFAQRAIASMDELGLSGTWSAYRTNRIGPPALLLSACLRDSNVGHACWQAYCVDKLYLHDATAFRARAAMGSADLAVTRLDADELTEEHRLAIYDRHGLKERLSVLLREDDGGMTAVNLYRWRDEPRFSHHDALRFRALSFTLGAAVRRHDTLVGRGTDGSDTGLRELMQGICPQLTARELDVCVGLLEGLKFDEIANDLQLSPTTVKSYRDRAFMRLNMRHRSELFQLILPKQFAKRRGAAASPVARRGEPARPS